MPTGAINDGQFNVEVLNTAFFEAQEQISPTIQQIGIARPSLWRTKLPRGTFAYGEGYYKKERQFHPGGALQDASRSWRAMQPSRPPNPATGDAGFDACKYTAPMVTYGFSEKTYSLEETYRRTPDICLKDILFRWQFAQQLSLSVSFLADVTLQEWENYGRETYVDMAQKVVCNKGMQEFALVKFSDEIDVTNVDLNSVGVLGMPMLSALYNHLYRQVQSGAVGNDAGMPVFGLVSSAETLDDLLAKDAKIREAYLYQNPGVLIEGIGRARTYKGYAHLPDPFTMRFAPSKTDATKLVRVWPYKATPTTIGEMLKIDPDYVNAPFEVSVVYLNDAVQVLVPPTQPSSVGGMSFDPNGWQGDFKWLNIQDRTENLLREKGFYFARFSAAARPLTNSGQALAILHRRCTDFELGGCNTSTVATRSASAQNVTSCFGVKESTTDVIVTVATPVTNTIGEKVTLVYGNSGSRTTVTSVVIADDSGNGLYRLAIPGSAPQGGWAAAINGGNTAATIQSA